MTELVLLLMGVCLSGCAAKDESAAPPGSSSTASAGLTTVDNVLSGGEPASEDEVRQFAEQMQDAVNDLDVKRFMQMMDWDAVLQRATGGFEEFGELKQAKRGFIEGAKKSLGRKGSGLMDQIVQHVEGGGSYRLLRVHRVDDRPRALFRLVLPEMGGVNYHDYVVETRDGQTIAADMYIYLGGELISETLRRSYLPVVQHASRGIMARLTGAESDYLRHIKKITQLAQAVRSGESEKALRIYYSLPASLRKDKNVMLMRLTAASSALDSEYESAIDEYRRLFPDDPSIDLISIDGYALKLQYDEARAAIDRLDKSLGGDPYLNLLRANIWVEQQDFAQAREFAHRGLEEEPDLIDAYWTLVTISLHEKQFARTAELLDEIQGNFEIEFADLTTVPEYSEFVSSPEYEEWLNRR